jgi:Holliday junction resolvase-like predicted endonuclease
VARITILEHDQDWLDLFTELLSEWCDDVRAVRQVPTGDQELATLVTSDVLIADWSLLHGGVIYGNDISRQAGEFVDELHDRGFDGQLIVVSALATISAIAEALQQRVRKARVLIFDKAATDWNVLVDLVQTRAAEPHRLRRPRRSDESTAAAIWDRLLTTSDATGRQLERAVSAMLRGEGLEHVHGNVLTVTSEMDIVVRHNSGYEAIFDPRYTVFECKDRSTLVSSSDVLLLDQKMTALSAALGVFVSRTDRVTGAKKSEAQDARRAMQDVVTTSGGQRAIVLLSYADCLSVVRKQITLEALLDEKVHSARMRLRRAHAGRRGAAKRPPRTNDGQ